MLEEYERKRNFAATPEPGPKRSARRGKQLTFVVQKHAASRLHYDFRLEADGVLKSWAVPRGPSLDPGVKRLAVQVEDHPLAYASFEGVIPEGQYGAGEVIVWDRGTYAPEVDDVPVTGDRAHAERLVLEGIAAGKLSFTMFGEKLRGSFALVRTSRDPGQWLLIKHQDAATDPGRDVTSEDRSVVSGLSLAEIAAGARPTPRHRRANRRDPNPRPSSGGLAPAHPDRKKGPGSASMQVARSTDRASGLKRRPRGARKLTWPAGLAPMLPTLVSEPFSAPDWIFEPKLDGVRVLAMRQDGDVLLRSRNRLDMTDQYPALARAIAAEIADDVVLDGEIVALDAAGRPSFQLLQKRLNLSRTEDRQRADREVPVYLYVFDLLFHEGRDLRPLPLKERRRLLADVISPIDPIRVLPDLGSDGETAFRVAVDHGFEGLIAKRRSSRYESGQRSRQWLKIKSVASDEFIILGYTAGTGHRLDTFGSLLLGTRDEDGVFRYVGNVGTGFDAGLLRDLLRRLESLRIPVTEVDPALRKAVREGSRRAAAGRAREGATTWVRPELVAEVKFASWTDDGRLRAPVFLRLREDKPAREVQVIPVVPPPAAEPSAGETVAEVLEQLAQPKATLTLTIERHAVQLTSLDKALWPKLGQRRALTKRDLIRYYVQVSDSLLPHLRHRPLSLLRYPNGIAGARFFQKHWEGARPEFVETVNLYSEHNDADGEYLLCNNLATLVWLGQIANLELHTWFSRTSPEPDGQHLGTRFTGSLAAINSSLLNYPDFLVFDLDPYIYSGREMAGEEPELNRAAFQLTCELAHHLRELLEGLGLAPLLKTTGRTGLHVFAPIVRTLDYAATRAIAETVAEHLRAQHPKLVTTEWSVENRTGRVFVDFNMNGRGKTVASLYSPRNLPEAAVSVPLRWDELGRVYPTGFTIETVPARLAEMGDLWASIMSGKRDVKSLLESSAA